MTPDFESALNSLTPIQKDAVFWNEGAALILAGPGAGKTRVLTTRIAKLLSDSPEKRFKILALTYTTKAATEMHERVESFIPGLVDERTFIGTFHAFCTNILRQHGSHIGINPDFGILGKKEELEELFNDAIKDAIGEGKNFKPGDISLLVKIKKYKSQLISMEKVLEKTKDQHLYDVYKLYEDSLKNENIIDFEGLIFETCRLLAKVPAVAKRIRQSYPYWMIDEFQDTTPAQYWLIHYLSGGEFKNIFIVADDDQIIFQWAGASYKQIEKFRTQFEPKLIQLVENHRCPPEIVKIANYLVANNTERTPEKLPIISNKSLPINAVTVSIYDTDTEEVEGITENILALGEARWGDVVILGRTRTILESVLGSLKIRKIKAVLAQRRDSFISPQFVWLHSCLEQAIRPTNKRVFTLLVNTGNRITNLEMDHELLISQAETLGKSFFEYYGECLLLEEKELLQKMGNFIKKLAEARNTWKKITDELIPMLLKTGKTEDGSVSATEDDFRAWNATMKEIRLELGNEAELAEVIQDIGLRSKEPPLEEGTVTLMTIHGSKGLEFKIVYVIGLAEGEIPSWQSCREGDSSQQMEEERRNCFVAITRTQEKLNLSLAKSYAGRKKAPSRFLKEMSLLE